LIALRERKSSENRPKSNARKKSKEEQRKELFKRGLKNR